MKKNWLIDFLNTGNLKKLWRIMRITVVLIVGFIMTVNAESYSQATRLDIRLENRTIRDVIEFLEDNSEFVFLYKNEDFNIDRKVNVDLKNASINQILDKVFEGEKVSYDVYARQIVIRRAEVLKLNAQQDKKNVTGVVTDTDGLPLPGVSVIVKGTTTGTVTDIEGKFNLEIPLTVKTLQFSFVGMKTQDVAIAGKTTVIITMEEVAIGIEEVVAIGYGSQKKANLTGAVGIATSERLENRPIVSVGQGLQGVIPNLNIKYRNGDPTTAADFNIRGNESISGGSPLILVDGVPMDLEQINPNDVLSVTVLKDAASAAVYGARASFGVILVETKKGKTGKINVQLSTEQSLAKPIFLIDPVTDPYTFVTEYNKASMRTDGVNYYDDDYIARTKAWSENPTEENAWGVVNGKIRYYGYNDYVNKVITDFAPQQKYDMTISGATKAASYYVSFGYLKKDGYLNNSEKNEHFQRYNILMKADFKVNDWLSLDEKIVFNSRVNDKPHFYNWDVNVNSTARQEPIALLQFPDLPYYIEPGDHDKYAQYIGMHFDGETSFIPYLEQGGRNTFTSTDIWLTQGITLTPLKGLKIRSDFSFNSYNINSQDVASRINVVSPRLYDTPMITNGFSINDFMNNQSDYNQYYVFNAYAEYTMEQYTDHYFRAMVGFNQEWGRNSSIRGQAQSLITPLITDLNGTTGPQQVWGGKSHVSLRGAFYRLNYIYKDKYLLEANGRYDGTSRFPKDSRFGFFPSVSVGWRISNEGFMAGTEWLDNLKIRASYGVLGNQLLGNNYYPYIASMGSGSTNYVFSSGFNAYTTPSELVSPNLTWETVTSQNIGLDFSILNQRLNISADVYTRDTKDMLMRITYPEILGTTAPYTNAADLRTSGWEISATWRDKVGQDWNYGLTLALSDYQAEITKYENPTNSLSSYIVGQKMGNIWGYETQGIFQTEEEIASAASQLGIGSNWKPGDIRYADLNGDGIINKGKNTLDDPGDQRIIGNVTPRYSFGINPDVSYKNWSLNIFFQGLFRDYLPDAKSYSDFYPYNSSHVENYFITETWSEDNRDAYFPAPHISRNTAKNIQPQSRYVQNAAYVRLKNLTLNYYLPQEWVSKVGLSRAQVYFSGMNLWEYTKMHKPIDPESTTTGVQEYYVQRIFTLGVKVTF